MIVIWTTAADTSSDRVVSALEREGATYLRLDIDAQAADENGVEWNSQAGGALVSGGHRCKASDVSAIYYRRPYVSEVTDDARDFATHEALYFTRCVLLRATSARWMSHPSRVLEAENKLWQLSVAEASGMSVPRTLVSSDPRQALDFYLLCDRDVVCKPGFAGFVRSPTPRAVYTWRLGEDLTQMDLESVRAAPTLLQERVEKVADIRVTHVGGEAIAVRIRSPPGTLDWRQEIDGDLAYELAAVPSGVARGMSEVLRRLGLTYGAFDFAETPDGSWVFLEVNPVGQWEWLQVETGADIAGAIAGWLVQG
ncbi:MAG: hypothetical protein OXT09_36235 [Myxococcales bacterium]|nr:hypothetical protein [Myxococcales bacterium]